MFEATRGRATTDEKFIGTRMINDVVGLHDASAGACGDVSSAALVFRIAYPSPYPVPATIVSPMPIVRSDNERKKKNKKYEKNNKKPCVPDARVADCCYVRRTVMTVSKRSKFKRTVIRIVVGKERYDKLCGDNTCAPRGGRERRIIVTPLLQLLLRHGEGDGRFTCDVHPLSSVLFAVFMSSTDSLSVGRAREDIVVFDGRPVNSPRKRSATEWPIRIRRMDTVCTIRIRCAHKLFFQFVHRLKIDRRYVLIFRRSVYRQNRLSRICIRSIRTGRNVFVLRFTSS